MSSRATVALFVSLVALDARAQSLVVFGVPAELRLAGRTGGVTFERRAADGTAHTSGNLAVLVTAPPGGQVASAPEPFASWGMSVTVSITPGNSASPPVYLRAGRPGVASWTASAAGFTSAVVTVRVREDALTCDLESGTTLEAELPAGCFNMLIKPYAQSSLLAVAAAAHRGNFGLRLVDAESSNGDAADTALFDDGAPVFGDFHARSWVKVVTTNSMGSPIIAQLTNASGASPSLIDVKVRSDLGLSLGGFGADAGYSQLDGDAGLRVGVWHLLELSVTGAGSSDGGRHVWVDGAPVLEQRGVDFSGTTMPVGRLAIGEPYADDRRWLGTIDFDDVRSAGVPLASQLALQAATDGGFVGECFPLEVQLRASFGGGLATTREPVDVRVDAGGGAEVFIDSACAVPGAQASLAPDASVVVLSLRAVQPVASLEVSTRDFLSGTREVVVTVPPMLEVSPLLVRAMPGQVVTFVTLGGTGRGVTFRMVVNPSGGSVDAAGNYRAGPVTGGFDVVEARDSAGQTALGTIEVVDAGVVDAGVMDAGVMDAGVVDAGEVDAGEVDAGEVDAGITAPRSLGIGCGCTSGGESLFLLFLVALLSVHPERRRGATRSS